MQLSSESQRYKQNKLGFFHKETTKNASFDGDSMISLNKLPESSCQLNEAPPTVNKKASLNSSVVNPKKISLCKSDINLSKSNDESKCSTKASLKTSAEKEQFSNNQRPKPGVLGRAMGCVSKMLCNRTVY